MYNYVYNILHKYDTNMKLIAFCIGITVLCRHFLLVVPQCYSLAREDFGRGGLVAGRDGFLLWPLKRSHQRKTFMPSQNVSDVCTIGETVLPYVPS